MRKIKRYLFKYAPSTVYFGLAVNDRIVISRFTDVANTVSVIKCKNSKPPNLPEACIYGFRVKSLK